MPHVAEHLLLRPTRTVALVPPHAPLTAEALHARVLHLMRRLRRACGGELNGRLVALAAPATNACLLEALFAVTAVGAVLAPLNSRWSSAEAARSLLRCGGAAVLLLHPAATLHWHALVTQHAVRHIVLLNDQAPPIAMDSTHALVATAAPPAHMLCASRLVTSPHGVAVVCFTSGTTGASKGAAISHTALWTQSMSKLTALSLTPQDVYLNLAPLFHIGGLSYALAATLAGAVHVFPEASAAFAPARRLSDITAYGVTVFIAAPALLEGLIGCSPALPANTRAAALGSVRMIALGAGPATSKLLEEAFATFPRARIVTAYGMTEACSTIALREAARSYAAGGAGGLGEEAWRHVESCAEGRRGGGLSVESGMCVGRPAPHAEVAILRADGQLAGPGHEGEVLTRGTHIMTGYWNDVNETRNSILADGGWLRTGDIGYLDDDGQLWLLGRQKDVVRTGSENVHAREVEAVLTEHPGIRAAAVVGVPDDKLGECVSALLVLEAPWVWSDASAPPSDAAGHTLGPAEVRRHCEQCGLSRYKLPRVMVAQAQPLPTDGMGKVSKMTVRQQLCSFIAAAKETPRSRL